jgi:heterotetrameric sarcosine oxidase delta subunit
MLQLECPWCGVRDEEEFRYGGEADIERPSAASDDARWGDYLFMRANSKGCQRERWLHAYGCNRWFELVRDTVTHDVRRSERTAADAASAPGAGTDPAATDLP